MTRSLDLHALICVCGVALNFHRNEANQSLTCAEARDRQFLVGEQVPQTVEREVAAVVRRVELTDRVKQALRATSI